MHRLMRAPRFCLTRSREQSLTLGAGRVGVAYLLTNTSVHLASRSWSVFNFLDAPYSPQSRPGWLDRKSLSLCPLFRWHAECKESHRPLTSFRRHLLRSCGVAVKAENTMRIYVSFASAS